MMVRRKEEDGLVGRRRPEEDDPEIKAGGTARGGSGDSKQPWLGWNELVRRKWGRLGLGQGRGSTAPGGDDEGRPEAESTSQRCCFRRRR